MSASSIWLHNIQNSVARAVLNTVPDSLAVHSSGDKAHPIDMQNAGWPLSRQCEIPWYFPDSWRHSSAALGMLSVTHIMPVLVLNNRMNTNIQFIINSFRQLFPDKIFFPYISLIFSKIPDISLTAVKFPDISMFSRQVIILCRRRSCWSGAQYHGALPIRASASEDVACGVSWIFFFFSYAFHEP